MPLAQLLRPPKSFFLGDEGGKASSETGGLTGASKEGEKNEGDVGDDDCLADDDRVVRLVGVRGMVVVVEEEEEDDWESSEWTESEEAVRAEVGENSVGW